MEKTIYEEITESPFTTFINDILPKILNYSSDSKLKVLKMLHSHAIQEINSLQENTKKPNRFTQFFKNRYSTESKLNTGRYHSESSTSPLDKIKKFRLVLLEKLIEEVEEVFKFRESNGSFPDTINKSIKYAANLAREEYVVNNGNHKEFLEKESEYQYLYSTINGILEMYLNLMVISDQLYKLNKRVDPSSGNLTQTLLNIEIEVIKRAVKIENPYLEQVVKNRIPRNDNPKPLILKEHICAVFDYFERLELLPEMTENRKDHLESLYLFYEKLVLNPFNSDVETKLKELFQINEINEVPEYMTRLIEIMNELTIKLHLQGHFEDKWLKVSKDLQFLHGEYIELRQKYKLPDHTRSEILKYPELLELVKTLTTIIASLPDKDINEKAMKDDKIITKRKTIFDGIVEIMNFLEESDDIIKDILINILGIIKEPKPNKVNEYTKYRENYTKTQLNSIKNYWSHAEAPLKDKFN